jgi:hypothetical protein
MDDAGYRAPFMPGVFDLATAIHEPNSAGKREQRLPAHVRVGMASDAYGDRVSPAGD